MYKVKTFLLINFIHDSLILKINKLLILLIYILIYILVIRKRNLMYF